MLTDAGGCKEMLRCRVSQYLSLSAGSLLQVFRCLLLLGLLFRGTAAATAEVLPMNGNSAAQSEASATPVTLFLAGDVMTGRGIDQILPHPGNPVLYEPFMRSAEGYVKLAEQANGPIPKPVDSSYIWGDALEVLKRVAPDVRVINLETSVTASDDYMKGKGINYRMHPNNIDVLAAAGINVTALANNHVLDWGDAGLEKTLDTLRKAGIRYTGAGRNLVEAQAPAVVEAPGKSRVLVFGYGLTSSGIPPNWAATADRQGVNLLPDLSTATVRRIAEQVGQAKRPGDVVVASIHWGGNWGYEIPSEQRHFARQLIDHAGIDIVHGHSSHHPKGIEVYRDKLIIYGAGDFINDYEGIGGHEEYRSDLSLMYFPAVHPATGKLLRLEMMPMRIRRFQVRHASSEDARRLRDVLGRESRKFGAEVELSDDGILTLEH